MNNELNNLYNQLELLISKRFVIKQLINFGYYDTSTRTVKIEYGKLCNEYYNIKKEECSLLIKINRLEKILKILD
jgi:hypothetical protein